MQGAADISCAFGRDPEKMTLLKAVASLGLPDCWVGAGFVRNWVWDQIFDVKAPPLSADVDVIYFDAKHIEPQKDRGYEAELSRINAQQIWSVKNQARMHVRNKDAPYTDSQDAMRHWPETCTVVAVRYNKGKVEILVPYGVSDLLAAVVRSPACFQHKKEEFLNRMVEKNWKARWPRLTFVG